MIVGKIRIEGMEFYAYHGCFQEEQVIGNKYIVDLTLHVNMDKSSESDDLNDTLNYASAYEIVAAEMKIRSHLLEHLCARILKSLFENFSQLDQIEINVAKLNPPLGGQVHRVSVYQQKFRN